MGTVRGRAFLRPTPAPTPPTGVSGGWLAAAAPGLLGRIICGDHLPHRYCTWDMYCTCGMWHFPCFSAERITAIRQLSHLGYMYASHAELALLHVSGRSQEEIVSSHRHHKAERKDNFFQIQLQLDFLSGSLAT